MLIDVKREDLLTTGEFAHLCDTTKETVMHYRRKGLLMPMEESESGYFYYDPFQYLEFTAINNLQQAGFSLKEIDDIKKSDQMFYLDNLSERLRNIEKEIFRLSQLYTALSNDLNMLNALRYAVPNAPFIEREMERWMLETKVSKYGLSAKETAEAIKMHFSNLEQLDLQNDMSVIFLFEDGTGVLENDTPYSICSTLRQHPNPNLTSLTFRKQKAGRYLSMFTEWPWDSFNERISMLKEYAVQQQLELCNEIYIIETRGLLSHNHYKSENLNTNFSKIAIRIKE